MKSQFAAHKSYEYARGVINHEIPVPKYVIKQCEKFIEIFDGKSDKYFLDEEKLNSIDNILKLLIMPRGLKSGQNIYDCSCGYQWLLYASALCVVYRENPNKRRYETVCLLGREIVNDKNVEYAYVNYEPEDVEYLKSTKGSASYREIKEWIKEQHDVSVSNLYITQVKDKLGFEKRENYNKGADGHRVPNCPAEKEKLILEAFKHFRMI